MLFLGVQRQTHLLLAYLTLVEEDVGDLIDPGAGPPAVRDLGVRATLPEFDLPTCYLRTHLLILLKRSAMDRFSFSSYIADCKVWRRSEDTPICHLDIS